MKKTVLNSSNDNTGIEATGSEKIEINWKEIYETYKRFFEQDESARREYNQNMANKRPLDGDKFSDFYAGYISEPIYQLPAYVDTIKNLVKNANTIDDEALHYIFSANLLRENQPFAYSVVQANQTAGFLGYGLKKIKIIREHLSLFEHIILTELQTKDGARGSLRDQSELYNKEIAKDLFLDFMLKKVSATRIFLVSPAYEAEYYRKNERVYFHPLNIMDIKYYYPSQVYSYEALSCLLAMFEQDLKKLFQNDDVTTQKNYLEDFLNAGNGHFMAFVNALKMLKDNNDRYNPHTNFFSFQNAIELLLTEREECADKFKRLAVNYPDLFLNSLLVKENLELKESAEHKQSLFDDCRKKCQALSSFLYEIQSSIKNIIPPKSFLESGSTQPSSFEKKLAACKNLQDLQNCLRTFPYREQTDALIEVLILHLSIVCQENKPTLEAVIDMIRVEILFPDEVGKRLGGRFMPIQGFNDNNSDINEATEGFQMLEMKKSGNNDSDTTENTPPREMRMSG